MKSYRKSWRRAWGYRNCYGDWSITCREDTAREWRQMFRERGETDVVFELRVYAMDRKGIKEINQPLREEK